ncbi:MAG TPA: transporter [Burkholderiaceae bacterium]
MFLLLPVALLHAQEADSIATDRPDFVESSQVVGKGRLQVESSVALERDRVDGVRARTLSTPLLLRYGIADTVELRVETDGRLHSSIDGLPLQRGYSDASVGAKWHLREQDGALPATAILAHVDLRTGSQAVRAAAPRPSLRVVGEWEWADEFSFGLMPGIASERDEHGARRTSAIFAAVLGRQWSDRLRSFIEIAAPRLARSRDGGSQVTLDIGAAYLLSPTVQLDTALARGLNRHTADLSWTVGLSFKL